MQQWQGNKFAGLYLYGTPGTGKTHAAIGLGRALQEQGADIFYRFGPEVVTGTSITSWNRYPGGQNGIFPGSVSSSAPQNRKRVCIFDEYKPDQQGAFGAAVETAAQYGGLIIATSNYVDPFELAARPNTAAASAREALEYATIKHLDPEATDALETKQTATAEAFSASLRSRIASGFRFIEFTGPDLRAEQSFWD